MLTCSFWVLQRSKRFENASKEASLLALWHTENCDILSGKAKHLCQFVVLWKGKWKHRSNQRLSALAKLLNDNQLFDVLTLIACNEVSNACNKERTSRWFFAHSHAGAHIANLHADAASFRCMWIALRVILYVVSDADDSSMSQSTQHFKSQWTYA